VAALSSAWTPDGPPATSCAWCAASLADGRRLRGRTVCARCGVATTSPWPTPEQLDAAYAGYRPSGGRFGGPLDALLRATRSRLARRIDARAPAGPVLDVGAGDGTLCFALAHLGREAVGLEREVPQAIATARPRPRFLDATVHDLDGPFAAVVLWHSLEHLPDPGATLDRIARDLLAPGGLLVVAVPDAQSWQARVFGDDWLALDLPRHLTHIPHSALHARLRAGGLQVERTSAWRGGQALFGWGHGLTKRLTGRDLYDAIRRPEARFAPMTGTDRAVALGTAAATLPLAAAAAAAEVLAGCGGSAHVEARRPTAP
jgi:SAM-dependent methyltransferase